MRRSLDRIRATRITLNVDPAEVRDLLERVPRACMAFAEGDAPRVEPVDVVVKDDHYVIGMSSSAASHPALNQEVVLLVDDGVQFFDLRAMYVRGHVQSLVGEEVLWFAVSPTRTVAWDYACIREVDDEA